jgi:hypothetical protein
LKEVDNNAYKSENDEAINSKAIETRLTNTIKE